MDEIQLSSNPSGALSVEHYQTFEIAKTNDDVLGGTDIALLKAYSEVMRAAANSAQMTMAAAKNLGVVSNVKQETAQLQAKVSVFADTRIGELLKELPTSKGGRPKNSPDVTGELSKGQAIKEAGISKGVAGDLEALASNPDVVQETIDRAEADGRVVTRSQVLKEIAKKKEEEKQDEEPNMGKLDKERKTALIKAEVDKGNPTAIEAQEMLDNHPKQIHEAYLKVRPNGDKSDDRRLCVICHKPIDEGDYYKHNRYKHKHCAMVDTEIHRGRKGGRKGAQYAPDGRRICSICGEPINEGEAREHHSSMHSDCWRKRNSENQRKYRDADHDLRENVAVYTIDSLVAELTASAVNMRDAIAQSIEINESMGVKVTNRQKDSLNKAIDKVFKSIERMRG